MLPAIVKACPICGHPGVGELGLDAEQLKTSYFICCCCGCEFGLDDTREYRWRWMKNGCPWLRESEKPANWDAKAQLQNANMRWPLAD